MERRSPSKGDGPAAAELCRSSIGPPASPKPTSSRHLSCSTGAALPAIEVRKPEWAIRGPGLGRRPSMLPGGRLPPTPSIVHGTAPGQAAPGDNWTEAVGTAVRSLPRAPSRPAVDLTPHGTRSRPRLYAVGSVARLIHDKRGREAQRTQGRRRVPAPKDDGLEPERRPSSAARWPYSSTARSARRSGPWSRGEAMGCGRPAASPSDSASAGERVSGRRVGEQESVANGQSASAATDCDRRRGTRRPVRR